MFVTVARAQYPAESDKSYESDTEKNRSVGRIQPKVNLRSEWVRNHKTPRSSGESRLLVS